jgi:parallel beta-helix repeat protein
LFQWVLDSGFHRSDGFGDFLRDHQKSHSKKQEGGIMEAKKIRIMGSVLLGVFICLSSTLASGQCEVSIGSTSYSSIQAAINSVSSPYTTIHVGGTCNENLFISELKDYLSLVGPATIYGTPDPSQPVIQTIGKGTRIQNLTLRGGRDGIQVIRGGTAFIENNTIENNERSGIILAMNGYAHILGNTIQANPEDGISVTENSTARIGVRSHDDTGASPNTIRQNAYGVTVSRSSSGLIVGNTIGENTYDGIRIAKASQADICSNVVDDNGRHGIFVTQNSGVNLGRDTGTSIFDLPNTTTVANGEKGLSCSIGGYADGRLGSLKGTGKNSATHFTKNCVDSLIP